MRIFVLEDDAAIGVALRYSLEHEGYDVTLCKTVREALETVAAELFSLYLLDLTLPDGSGYDVCKAIKARGDLPVIFLTAYDDEINVVTGFELGADDYITKPFNPAEVTARVRSQLRRYTQLGSRVQTQTRLVNGGIELDDAAKEVRLDGDTVSLTPKEYEILKLLMTQPGRVFAPDEIYSKVWGEEPLGAEGTVAVHIRHLREKLEIDPAEPRYIRVVWGQGYRMEKWDR